MTCNSATFENNVMFHANAVILVALGKKDNYSPASGSVCTDRINQCRRRLIN